MIRLKSLFYSILLFFPLFIYAIDPTPPEIKKWKEQAARVTIIRDPFGIPHIYGKTDADAVFGLLYAQCEDDFKRIELNYIEKLGRLSELRGEGSLYDDLYIRMILDPEAARKEYKQSPPWLKKLLHAFADGINFYLYRHPEVRPALLHRFEPWYPLLWTDGSIGAINTADVGPEDLKKFYTSGETGLRQEKMETEGGGSNGFAIAPARSASGNAMLYINPHVTFYFRPEVHMVSEEGLNAYGAVTWGQFFIYQGFNPYCGWMHTSCNVDVADVYIETTSAKGRGWTYQYEKKALPVTKKRISLNYKDGTLVRTKTFDSWHTHHGPVMAIRDGHWATVRSNNRSLDGLKQSWLRTRATGFEAYKKTMDLKSNISNNTVYADAGGHIAYWHGNFIPRRKAGINWSKPVDGSTKTTEWQGLHPVEESVHVYNPPNGWLQNCNSTPFTSAGKESPLKANYPPYMAPDGENFRGINAVKVLSSREKFDLDDLIRAGYNTWLSAFEVLVPALVEAFDNYGHGGDNKFDALEEPVKLLKNWDYHSGVSSVETTLAIEWAQRLGPSIQKVYIDEGEDDQVNRTRAFARTATEDQLLQPLLTTVEYLTSTYGSWKTPWGEINRFQRLSGDIVQKPDDAKPSLPVGFAPATWGMLPSYNSRRFEGTKKRYGISGNSFICAVEFGPRIRAKSLLAGGQSGDPASPHFKDQAERYTTGTFKEVLFYREDVEKKAIKKYRPGE